MCDVLVKGCWKVCSLTVFCGESHLNVVEMADGTWYSQVHGFELPNETFKLLTGHTSMCRRNIQQLGQVRNVFGGKGDGSFGGVYNPPKDFFGYLPITVPCGCLF